MQWTIMKDWKLIFNAKSYHYILIKELRKETYLKFFFEHQMEIETVPSFFFMLPSKEDLQKTEHNDYVSRFAPLLKSFIDNPQKTTLFIEEDVLKAIVKEDKLSNFFRYISKSNKNIVLFFYSDISKYPKALEYTHIEFLDTELEKQYELLDTFNNIKLVIDRKNNPFKDPVAVFSKHNAATETPFENDIPSNIFDETNENE